MTIDKQNIDFRVSTLPAYHGESVPCFVFWRPDNVRYRHFRISDSRKEDNKAFQKIIQAPPNGIFLVTGPTGSGKDDDAVRRAEMS